MKQNTYSVTVGIPTYLGLPSLVKTVDSIRASVGVSQLRIIVSVDGKPLSKKVKAALLKRKITLIENKKRGGQVARINQIISRTGTDILILAQDDVLFDIHAIKNMADHFLTHTRTTMVGARIMPMDAQTFFEKIVETGVFLTHSIGENWKNGDNYLLSSGRCLAFRANFIKKVKLPEEIINSDSHLYFLNKNMGGKFIALKNAIVYNRSPQNIIENNKQSKKFQISRFENEKFIMKNLDSEYNVPFIVKFLSFISIFLIHPFFSTMYLFLFIQSRFFGKNIYISASRFWESDRSTKKI